jgi:hypothetical protein
MIKQMAIVKITSYTKNRGAAKASVRYITHRPGGDGRQATRPLYSVDGEVTKTDAYNMIDEAKRGAVFFRIVISPDPQKEDASNDLYLWQITEQTMLTLEDRLKIHIPFIAADHDDHTGHRHVHLLACAKARIERQDLKALRDSATEAALVQRQERDLVRQAKLREVQEVQWAF